MDVLILAERVLVVSSHPLTHTSSQQQVCPHKQPLTGNNRSLRCHAIMLTIVVCPVAHAVMLTRYLSLSISAAVLQRRQAGPLSRGVRQRRADRRCQPREVFRVICVWGQKHPHDGVQMCTGGTNQEISTHKQLSFWNHCCVITLPTISWVCLERSGPFDVVFKKNTRFKNGVWNLCVWAENSSSEGRQRV